MERTVIMKARAAIRGGPALEIDDSRADGAPEPRHHGAPIRRGGHGSLGDAFRRTLLAWEAWPGQEPWHSPDMMRAYRLPRAAPPAPGSPAALARAGLPIPPRTRWDMEPPSNLAGLRREAERLERVAKLARAVPCRDCRANPGAPCRGRTGLAKETAHDARVRDWRAARPRKAHTLAPLRAGRGGPAPRSDPALKALLAALGARQRPAAEAEPAEPVGAA
jgi:hypothetical protein